MMIEIEIGTEIIVEEIRRIRRIRRTTEEIEEIGVPVD